MRFEDHPGAFENHLAEAISFGKMTKATRFGLTLPH
jgi:hypothetical protein